MYWALIQFHLEHWYQFFFQKNYLLRPWLGNVVCFLVVGPGYLQKCEYGISLYIPDCIFWKILRIAYLLFLSNKDETAVLLDGRGGYSFRKKENSARMKTNPKKRITMGLLISKDGQSYIPPQFILKNFPRDLPKNKKTWEE